MQYFPPALEKLVEQFARLPGIGRKTAQRLAFFVLSLPEEDAALLESPNNILGIEYCKALLGQNAPLRAVVNGRVRSVGEDFYDDLIRRNLPEGRTKIANIIGEVLGREKPGIGDVWLAERIRQMLSTGELRMLREDRERFYRSVVERT